MTIHYGTDHEVPPDYCNDHTQLRADCGCPPLRVVTDTPKPKPSVRDRVIRVLSEEFTLGRSIDDRPFAVERDGLNVALFSGAAKSRLAARLVERGYPAPARAALDEAWVVAEGRSLSLPRSELPLRVAHHLEGVVLDLGRADGKVVAVDSTGWRILDRSPITFRRSRATAETPIPVHGGTWTNLWTVVNVSPDDRDLVRGWLVHALLPTMSHAILRIVGEQGAAKTTATDLLARIIDPSPAGVLKPPKDSSGWDVSCNARWCVPLDNVSRIEPWLSDALCRTATGAGSLDRALYTDSEVSVRFLRAVPLINGISMTGGLRADLAERLLSVELHRPADYFTDSEVRALFNPHHGSLLGLVLDDLVAVLRHQPTTAIPRDLRMAALGHVLASLDAGAGTRSLERYRHHTAELSEEALESDLVALTILRFMENRGSWEGTPLALYRKLDPIRQEMLIEGEASNDSYWPKTAGWLVRSLPRSAKTLRDHGITYVRERESGARTITLTTAERGMTA